jgi:hypothetical protein
MSRFTSFSGAALLSSLSLFFAASAKADDVHMHADGHLYHSHGRAGGIPFPGAQSGVFGGMSHIDQLAENTRYLANHVTFDMWYNYQFNPGFQEIYAKCYAFRNLSYSIHDMEHTGQHVEMAAAIQEMDTIFHSLEHDIAGWYRTPRLQIGQGDIHYKMEMLEDVMHHLLHDAGVRSQDLINQGTPPTPDISVDGVPPVPGAGTGASSLVVPRPQ